MKSLARQYNSIWYSAVQNAEHRTVPSFPSLVGTNNHANVVVIGGGMTGLSAAMTLSERGHGDSVVVLEGALIGGGVSGTTTGKFTALHRTVYQEIYQTWGKDGIRKYAQLHREGFDRANEWVERYNIDCNWYRTPNYTYCFSRDKVDMLRKECDLACEAGLNADFAEETPEDLPFEVAARVRVPDEARCNTYALCKGLADAMSTKHGVRVFENSTVTNVNGLLKSPYTLETASGATITADNVIIATGSPITDRSGHFGFLKVVVSYCMAFEVDEAALNKYGKPLLSGMYINPHDDEEESFSIRIAEDAKGRPVVVVSAYGHEEQADPPKGSTEKHYQLTEELARRKIPYLGATISHWSAEDFKAPDVMPYIGHLMRGSDGLYTATGFMKWGLTGGAGAAGIIADLIEKKENPLADIFDARRWDLTSSLVELVKNQAHVGKVFIGDRIKDHMTALPDIEELGRGCGGVCHLTQAGASEKSDEPSTSAGHHKKVVGGYRDDNNTLHAVDLLCTHLGCHVRWNGGDKSWDCPCHGSRFSPTDGAVLHGPATKPLEVYL